MASNKVYSVLELSSIITTASEHFRNAYNLAFDAAFSKDIKYWLTDATHIEAMEKENQIKSLSYLNLTK